ncbi:MAG: PhzF family phenazine biosynthesis protein [Anaerotignum propionicum]|uniref:PhzF family phenazine biosynthesis protein n=1 Tax=Anaerotignum propionicum TaxID=28446 RepID=UPI002B2131F4|nr:PhzF family phenazine biosynthesis protein [Anaerotignum propionicum]MEA5057451.1 PhzF family phenazine biosynthesis protein [Anaerotignum propionicum]
MIFYHVDVFSSKILSGNGLTVIFHEEDMSKDYMQAIAQEFKQFETIFLRQIEEKRFRARIFTVEEELDFAGHPILGAMAVIHEKLFTEERNITAVFELNNKSLQGESVKKEGYFQATMNQGAPAFLGTVEGESVNTFLQALNLTTDYLHPSLPMEVVSTGLPYLIVPLTSGLEKARISVGDFEEQLGKVQAKFVYLFDVDRMEGRTWDNWGEIEDVATGSAAGPTGAYLYKWNIFNATDDITINQGGFVGRPSKIKVFADQSTGDIKVAGDVKIIAKGQLLI